MSSLFDPLPLQCGAVLKNRLALAPLTNCQSHADGTLSDDEYRCLVMRARGGFALTMTCASHVLAVGQGFPGQLGNFSDEHLPGLARLAAGIKSSGSLAMTQLHHAGMRSPPELIGTRPLCPSDNPDTGARAMTLAEIGQTRQAFVEAALRAERAGFDGVEIHGAHGYLLCQFLSATINLRRDDYGGPLGNRARLLFEIVDTIRARCRPGFIVGLRLSPERFGMQLAEVLELSQRFMDEGRIDFLDASLWDVFKEPEEEAFRGRRLLSYFTSLRRGGVRLGAAGRIRGGKDARDCLAAGVDFELIGQAAIIHHDFAARLQADPSFESQPTPVSSAWLEAEGVGPAFVGYLRRRPAFVAD